MLSEEHQILHRHLGLQDAIHECSYHPTLYLLVLMWYYMKVSKEYRPAEMHSALDAHHFRACRGPHSQAEASWINNASATITPRVHHFTTDIIALIGVTSTRHLYIVGSALPILHCLKRL